ncbi:MAG TPA: CRTAC1 family protein [Longimicrobium sp.]|nr:CRTAC1 family protein [Longimicrobium sp.]
MTPPWIAGFPRRNARRLAALAAVLAAFAAARLPTLSARERHALGGRFSFIRLELPSAGPVPTRRMRAVNPEFERIRGWISSVGAAVALYDVDGNGLADDACWVDPRDDRVVVTPAPGTGDRYAPFALVPASGAYAPGTTAPMGCLPGDLDEDGRADLLVYYWGRTPVAFLRSAGGPPRPGAFTAREVVAGSLRWFTNAATLADVDGDGHPDLVIGNYFPDGARVLDTHRPDGETMQASMSRAFNGGTNHLLLWAGARPGAAPTVRFREAPGIFAARAAHGWTLAIAAADLDGDLRPELYFANDFGPDRLFHNRSRPGHVDLAPVEGVRTPFTPRSKVLGRDSFKGMGAEFADLDGDGRLDLFVSNIARPFALEESHLAFAGAGDPGRMRDGVAPFQDRSEALGLSRSDWGWDAKAADLDNAGAPELLQATGFLRGRVDRWPELQELAMGNDFLLRHPGSWPRFGPGDDLSGHTHLAFFVRAPDGRYHDLAREAGVAQEQVTRGIAVADVDGDGRLDFAVAGQWEPSALYRNRSPAAGAFLGLRLLLPVDGRAAATRVVPGLPPGVRGRPAIGAEAVLRGVDGAARPAQVDGGNGHAGKRSPDLHWGLGRHPHGAPLRVELRWRDAGGRPRAETLSLAPGWHTVLLATGGSR